MGASSNNGMNPTKGAADEPRLEWGSQLILVLGWHIGGSSMIDKRGLAALGLCLGSISCAPTNPPPTSIVGRWTVDWTCGVETLELNANGTYSYAIDFTGGGRAVDSGEWKLVATTKRLEGAHVILKNALRACSTFGDRAVQQGREDRELETIWEWGRSILSFNPDIQGFTRG